MFAQRFYGQAQPCRKRTCVSKQRQVLSAPAASASRWVNEEVRYFRNLGRGDRIFGLIVDGEPNVRLKIIAGLLGVGFDVLEQRDLRRRNRRLMLVTSFALMLAGVVTALAWRRRT